MRGNRRREHDPAAGALPHHLPGRRLRAYKASRCVDVEDPAELGCRRLEGVRAAHDACKAHEHIYRSEAGGGFRDSRGDVLLVGDVHGHCFDLGAWELVPELLDASLRRVGVEIQEHKAREAVLEHCPCRFEANGAGAAGDDGVSRDGEAALRRVPGVRVRGWPVDGVFGVVALRERHGREDAGGEGIPF